VLASEVMALLRDWGLAGAETTWLRASVYTTSKNFGARIVKRRGRRRS
jgi:hypothetical protein